MNIFDILNSKLLYILVALGLLIIFLICVMFFLRAKKRAKELGIADEKVKATIKSSLVFSIVPSIAVIIGLITLTPLLGIPWPWFRLSVVGSLPYELTAADLAVKGLGYQDLTAYQASADPSAIGTIMFTMTISILGGMIFNIFFLEKYHKTVSGVGTKSSPFRELALSVLTFGMVTVFFPIEFLKSKTHAAVAITSILVTLILGQISKKYKIDWLADFIMSFALIIGMAAGVFFEGVL
ncbi:DUF5058 family protein [Anaerococcus sp. ENR0831]|uniref:DUF5058 family protein n=1 Tax=Anaerococcus martiniensis TaxID=3115615 RepID=A0ABW9M6D0_9FIRM